MQHIKERIADFRDFKEEVRMKKPHVTLFRQLFHYGRGIWKP